jgi:DNA (cytosine-5)-methyltransferase 1
MNTKLLSVERVSESTGLSPQQIRSYCRSGAIPASRVGKNWIIESKDLAQIQNLHPRDHVLPKKGKLSKKPIALSFFSGAMGLDMGIERAGFEIVLACEFDKSCRQTIQANRPDMALIGDINDYSASEILSAAGLSAKDDIDLMFGGPPCQAFSTAGRRKGFGDQRGNVFLTYLSRALDIRPKYFVIENVRGILSIAFPAEDEGFLKINGKKIKCSDYAFPGGAMSFIIDIMSLAGYGVSFNLYNAANFGSPQTRERVVIVCSRNGIKSPYLKPTHSENGDYGLPKWVTFRDAVRGLPPKCTHINFPEARLCYYRLLKPGQYWRHLPKEMQKKALGKSYSSGGGKTGFLRRLDWDRPSYTLVTNPTMPATDLAHPEELRPLSIEEYKRIQEFPDNWFISGSLLNQYKQIGNAVPTSLGLAIGKLIMNCIQGKSIKEIPNFPYSRYKKTSDREFEGLIKKKKNPSSMQI